MSDTGTKVYPMLSPDGTRTKFVKAADALALERKGWRREDPDVTADRKYGRN